MEFLGTSWKAGSAMIPPDTLRKIGELQMEGVTTINGNFRILEKACTWTFYNFPSIILTLLERQTPGAEMRT